GFLRRSVASDGAGSMSSEVTRWLIITLSAPLASFGEAAGNVRRSSADRPAKSALLGLVGAALGVRRDDKAGQAALAQGYQVASRTIRRGDLLQDFHTFQSLPNSSKPPPQTRSEALMRTDKLATSITIREYRSDVLFDAAYIADADARWPLEALAEAFRRPRFTLYLGRRSCPLGWPLRPQIVETSTIEEAFEARDRETAEFFTERLPHALRGRPVEIAVEEASHLRPANRARRRTRRQDQPGDRERWHFSARPEIISQVSEESGT
ncbi:MAG: type I-E CRISPR-associated protein Cas5/CasD, partial [Pseudomonadota bacterium]